MKLFRPNACTVRIFFVPLQRKHLNNEDYELQRFDNQESVLAD